MRKAKKLWRILIVFIIMLFILSGVIGSAILYMFDGNNETNNNQTNIERNVNQQDQKVQEEQQLKNLLNEVFSGNNNGTGN